METQAIVDELFRLYAGALTQDNKKDVSILIIELRKRFGLSLKAFAGRLGTNAQTAHRWEKGISLPQAVHLAAIRKFFNERAAEPGLPILQEHEITLLMVVTGDNVVLGVLAKLQEKLAALNSEIDDIVKIKSLNVRPTGGRIW